MPRNISGLRRGITKGRAKGTPNKSTAAIKSFARLVLESEAYRESLRARIEKGSAPHMEVLLHHYGYGKPKETVDLEGQVKTIQRIVHEELPRE